MKQATVSTVLVIRMHEQRPDTSVCCVADGEGDDFPFRFDDPSTSSLLDRFTNLVVADRRRNQPVLAHRPTNALDVRDVGENSLPQHVPCARGHSIDAT